MEKVRNERRTYHLHKALASTHADDFLSIILDGMDQAKTTLPQTRSKGDLNDGLNVKVSIAIVLYCVYMS